MICKAIMTFMITAIPAASTTAIELVESPLRHTLRIDGTSGGWRSSVASYQSDFDSDFDDSFRSPSGRKSRFRALLYSALIPGGGQYYLGNRRSARYYFAAEAATWIGFAAFRTYGNWRRNDYFAYAAVHANAQLEGKSEEFLAWVGFYDNYRQFNGLGRAFDPDRAYLEDIPENHWEWQSRDDRQTYKDLRNRSKEAYRRAEFMIGIAVVNRVISMIAAVRSVGKVNSRLGSGESSAKSNAAFKFSVNPFSTRRQIYFTVYPSF